MITRQIRLNTSGQIQKRSQEFIGKKINIVLCDRTVLFGELRSVDEKELTFVNMRLQPVKLLLKEVSEVYLDYKE